ncbi:LSM1 U6 small nuclear RNA associated [Paragonimus heterotremus]|uniref:U6 snRNA-associated Sm-like protein LSm1 n=1 Tax=Paragonimus heterotremus TaxID=100268 RepID=A0A8J4TGJ3_9TREM|nr:LSM1 U6 small nuclear RNA associated [Paragonimus heterotremus]
MKWTYPGSAKNMMVCLRGGRVYIGYLRIIDQFGNIVIHQAFERIHVERKFCDVPQGILMIRGENIILIGELNEQTNIEDTLERVSESEIYALQAEQTAARKALAKKRMQLFAERGLGLPDPSELMFDDG